MNDQATNSIAVNESPLPEDSPGARCCHHTRQGRCRMPVSDPSSTLCLHHARVQQKRQRNSDLSAELTSGLTEFKSAAPINDFLSRLLHLQAQDRIPPRRAAVMAYTCNLLLRTLPAIEHEEDAKDQEIIFDLPRPRRD